MRLNIIGNGFDLYHGLPSSYYYFGCFLAFNFPGLFVNMANMFGFSYKNLNKEIPKIEFEIDNLFWSQFEEALGNLDPLWIEETLQDDLGLECSDTPINLEIPETKNAQRIVDAFEEWIQEIVNTHSNFSKIRPFIQPMGLKFTSDDYFISFNYTQTLEVLYNISQKNILHIHGMCDLNGDTDELIVGHGNNSAIKKLQQSIGTMGKDINIQSKQYYLNRLTELQAELTVLKALKKNTSPNLEKMCDFLKNEKSLVKEIYVWGFSFGNVDMPYILQLAELYPNATWNISLHEKKEKTDIEKRASDFGIKNKRFFNFSNSYEKEIRREIVQELTNMNKIYEYPIVKR